MYPYIEALWGFGYRLNFYGFIWCSRSILGTWNGQWWCDIPSIFRCIPMSIDCPPPSQALAVQGKLRWRDKHGNSPGFFAALAHLSVVCRHIVSAPTYIVQLHSCIYKYTYIYIYVCVCVIYTQALWLYIYICIYIYVDLCIHEIAYNNTIYKFKWCQMDQ